MGRFVGELGGESAFRGEPGKAGATRLSTGVPGSEDVRGGGLVAEGMCGTGTVRFGVSASLIDEAVAGIGGGGMLICLAASGRTSDDTTACGTRRREGDFGVGSAGDDVGIVLGGCEGSRFCRTPCPIIAGRIRWRYHSPACLPSCSISLLLDRCGLGRS